MRICIRTTASFVATLAPLLFLLTLLLVVHLSRVCQLRKAEAAAAEALTAAKNKDLRTPSRKRFAIAAAGAGIAQSMASLQAKFLGRASENQRKRGKIRLQEKLHCIAQRWFCKEVYK